MMSADEHLKQAEYNEKTYKILININSNVYNWCVTILFYAIVHYAEYFLLKNDCRNSSTHEERKRNISTLLSRHGDSHNIYPCYETLYRESRTARYLGGYLDNTAKGDCELLHENEFKKLSHYFQTAI